MSRILILIITFCFASLALAQDTSEDTLIRALAWSPDATMVAYGVGNTVKISDDTGQIIASFSVPEEFTALDWGNDSATVIAGDLSGVITAYSIPDRSTTKFIELGGNNSDWYPSIYALAWRPNSTQFAVTYQYQVPGATVLVFDSSAREVVANYTLTDYVGAAATTVKWNSNGSKLAVLTDDLEAQIAIIDLISDTITSLAYGDFAESFDWLPEDEYIAGVIGKTLYIWSVSTGKVVSEEEMPYIMSSISWNPVNSNQYAVGTIDRKMVVSDINDTRSVTQFTRIANGQGEYPMLVDWSPDGTKVAYSRDDGRIDILDLNLPCDCGPATPITATDTPMKTPTATKSRAGG